MAKPSGKCSICGVFCQLSYEHVPPKGAFNNSRIMEASIEKLIGAKSWEEFANPTGKYNQKGAGGYTICESCNNNTGSWYVPRYVDWACQGMVYLCQLPVGYTLSIPFKIDTLCVIKQIIAMFGSACGPKFFEINQELRKFVLDKNCQFLPQKFRLYASLMSFSSTASRQAGITGLIRDGTKHVFSEIAFPPFVYVLSINSPPVVEGLQDITFFANGGLAQHRSIHLNLPIQPISSKFPGDYRTMSEIREGYEKSL